jgi:hypothetical protein
MPKPGFESSDTIGLRDGFFRPPFIMVGAWTSGQLAMLPGK